MNLEQSGSVDAHQFFHVAMIERIHGRLITVLHRSFELTDGIGCAFRVWIIGCEHEHLGTDIVDDPTYRLAGERRNLEVPVKG